MMVELIPVLESGYSHPDVALPDRHPYWEHPAIWDRYRQETHAKAGFGDALRPYLPGSLLYKPADFSRERLAALLKVHTEDLRNGKYTRQDCSVLFGGFVLRVDGQDVFFPQCCGTLSDIDYWEQLANGNGQASYQGHPAPAVSFNSDTVIFDFQDDEPFEPPPARRFWPVNKSALKAAVEKAKQELMAFSEVLEWINNEEGLNIERIDDLLIWGR